MAQSERKKAQDAKNLKPFATDRSSEEAVKNGRKGGIASGKARRERKALRELLESYLDKPATVGGQEVTRKDVMAFKAVQIVTEGTVGENITASEFVRAFEMVRDTLGEKPSEKVEVATADQAKFNELLEQLEGE